MAVNGLTLTSNSMKIFPATLALKYSGRQTGMTPPPHFAIFTEILILRRHGPDPSSSVYGISKEASNSVKNGVTVGGGGEGEVVKLLPRDHKLGVKSFVRLCIFYL